MTGREGRPRPAAPPVPRPAARAQWQVPDDVPAEPELELEPVYIPDVVFRGGLGTGWDGPVR